MNLNTNIKRYPVVTFILLTVGLSLAVCLLPFQGEMAFAVVALVLVMIPTFVAVGLEALMGSRRDAIAFLRECFRWRSALKWYILAIVIGFLMNFGVSVLALLLGHIAAITFSAPIVFRLLIVPHAALMEEIGWRGFALRRLLGRYSPFAASLIIGVPWGLIHVFIVFLYVPDRTGLWDGLSILPLTFTLTWIFIKSGRKVLVSTVLHIALNMLTFVAPMIPEGEWLAPISYSLVALVLVMIDWRMWSAPPAAAPSGETLQQTPAQAGG